MSAMAKACVEAFFAFGRAFEGAFSRMEKTLRDIYRQHRLFGYQDPSWFIWAANQIVQSLSAAEQAPGKDRERGLALFTALHMLRQGAAFSPYDRDLYAMLFRLQGLVNLPEKLLEWHRWVEAQVSGLGLGSQNDCVKAVDEIRDDVGAIVRWLKKNPPLNEYYMLLLELWRLGQRDLLLEWLQPFRELPGAAAAGPVLALAAWRAGESDLARQLAGMSPDNFLRHLMEAEQALERGDKDAAQAHWRISLKLEPMQPTLLLKMYDSLTAPPDPDLVRRNKVHIAFYTFNKLQMTLETLQSLLESDIGDAPISLLNNGSTEFSEQDFRAGVDAVRQGRPVNLIQLPTNIGAPAARNWLRCLPETAAADYLAYLDDDVLLPKNWLAHYLQDLKDFPQALVAGPQCINPGPISTTQYVWRYFERIGDHNIRFTNNCPQFMDFGQYGSRRLCLSVMGCCHLFDMRRWNGLGLPDFDIRFSPSQVDDLEHDMQIWKAKGQVVYDGRVRVVHRQDVGKQSFVSRAALGNVFANHRKMEAKWPGEDLTLVDSRVKAADDAYYLRCHEAVAGLVPDGAKNLLAMYCFR